MIIFLKENAVPIIIAVVTGICSVTGSLVASKVEMNDIKGDIHTIKKSLETYQTGMKVIKTNIQTLGEANIINEERATVNEQIIKYFNDSIIATDKRVDKLEKDSGITAQLIIDLSSAVKDFNKTTKELTNVVVQVARQDERIKQLERSTN